MQRPIIMSAALLVVAGVFGISHWRTSYATPKGEAPAPAVVATSTKMSAPSVAEHPSTHSPSKTVPSSTRVSGSSQTAKTTSSANAPSVKATAEKKPVQKTVLLIGSSVAEGWVDKQGGYLVRAFKTLDGETSVQYNVVSKAKAGDGVLQIVKDYPTWLQTIHPDIVVLSWGALDDLHLKTPMPVVRKQIQWEIDEATKSHALVFIVTPPITRASYTTCKVTEAEYVNTELAAAKAVNSPDVYIFDLFNQMKKYLVNHHQTYVPYMADGWHPNAAGHTLGGQILSTDVFNTFGTKPPVFQ